MLKTISEAVLFLGKQELAFRGHDELYDSLNRGNYRELLESFAKFKSVFQCRLHSEVTEGERVHSGVFTGISSDIQNDLIECIDSVLQDQIDKEIEKCKFVSIQADEITDVSTKEQLSVIIRLDREGEIIERFLKLFDVSLNRSIASISDVIRSILSTYGESVKEKLIMQTYDGASVMSGHIGGLQALICQEYPFAFFFHCSAHRLNLVLCQCASSLPTVKVFFANISAFSIFTSLSARRKAHFRSHGIEVPHPGDTRWCYNSRIISVIFIKYHTLLNLLENIVNNPQSWDDGSLTKASGLWQYVNSFLFCFLILFSTRLLNCHQFCIICFKTGRFHLAMQFLK